MTNQDKLDMINDMKKFNKNSIFGTIFYTILFLLLLISSLVVPDVSIVNKIVLTSIHGIVSIVKWVLYFKGKNEKRQLDEMIKDMEENPNSAYFDKYFTTEEERKELERRFNPLTKYIFILIIGYVIFLGLLVAIALVPLEHWFFSLLAILLLLFCVYFTIVFLKKGKEFYNYVDEVCED